MQIKFKKNHPVDIFDAISVRDFSYTYINIKLLYVTYRNKIDVTS